VSVLEEERHGDVVVLRINRPDRANALSREVHRRFGEAFRALADDPSVAVVVLTGAGDRVFCAGMDLKEFAEQSAAGSEAPPDESPTNGIEPIIKHTFPKPLIAAVNGTAFGGGFELVLGCDLVVAAEHARFGLPEVSRGLVPGGGGLFLSNRIPVAVALELVLTGDPISAAEAHELGLVNRVVPADRLLEETLELAARVARNGPVALRFAKRVMWRAKPGDDWDALWAESGEVFGSEDAREGAQAFAERRAPVWKGR
jgi:enoyl-CoA hydratase